MAEIITMDCVTRHDIPASRVIDNVPEMQDVVIIGYDADGEFYFASSKADGGDVLWMIEAAKKRLLEYS